MQHTVPSTARLIWRGERKGETLMANQVARQWLKPAVTKAAEESLGKAPQRVLLRQATETITFPAPAKPVYKVRAWVQMDDRGYEVVVNVAEDGYYSDFKTVK